MKIIILYLYQDIFTMSNLVTLYRYAQLCNASIQVIRYRVKKKHIKVVKRKITHTYIDIEAFPPEDFTRRKQNNTNELQKNIIP